VGCVCAQFEMEPIILRNAADEGVTMPPIGIGTGYYGMKIVPYGTYPKCGDEVHPPNFPQGPPAPGCGANAQRSVLAWLNIGGRRLDTANSYFNLDAIKNAIDQSGVKREEIFVLSKVGPSFPLGYQDTITQTNDILTILNTSYIDLMLVHWPAITGIQPPSSDPLCNNTNPKTYDEVKCRLATWRAMVYLWKSGAIRAIGVSNYNETHFEEIIQANLPLPSANQISFHPYISHARKPVVDYCIRHNILPIAYSPLGVPDWHKFPTKGTGMSSTILEDPVVVKIAARYSKSPAQVILRWVLQSGLPTNPRSMNVDHMKENLNIFDFALAPNDMNDLNNLAQDTCEVDPDQCPRTSTNADYPLSIEN